MLARVYVCVCVMLIWTAIKVLTDLHSHPRYVHDFPSQRSHIHTHIHLTPNIIDSSQICWCVSTWCIKETGAERSKTPLAVLLCSAPLGSDANVCQAIRRRRQAGRLECMRRLCNDRPFNNPYLWSPVFSLELVFFSLLVFPITPSPSLQLLLWFVCLFSGPYIL